MLDIKKLNSAFKNSQKDIKTLKNIFNRSLVTAKKANLNIESTIKKQRERIVELNQKIDAKKITRKTARPAKIITKKASAKKTPPKKSPKLIIRKRKSQDKTIITVKTPNKTLVEAVTPSKGGKVQVVKGKNTMF